MLLGHAHGEPVLLVRRGERVVRDRTVCTHYGAPLPKGCLSTIRSVVRGITPVSVCVPVRRCARRR